MLETIPTLSSTTISPGTRDPSPPALGGLRSGAFGALVAYAAARAALFFTGDPVAAELAAPAALQLVEEVVIPAAGFVVGFLATAGRKALADRKAKAAP